MWRTNAFNNARKLQCTFGWCVEKYSRNRRQLGSIHALAHRMHCVNIFQVGPIAVYLLLYHFSHPRYYRVHNINHRKQTLSLILRILPTGLTNLPPPLETHRIGIDLRFNRRQKWGVNVHPSPAPGGDASGNAVGGITPVAGACGLTCAAAAAAVRCLVALIDGVRAPQRNRVYSSGDDGQHRPARRTNDPGVAQSCAAFRGDATLPTVYKRRHRRRRRDTCIFEDADPFVSWPPLRRRERASQASADCVLYAVDQPLLLPGFASKFRFSFAFSRGHFRSVVTVSTVQR